MIQRLFCSDYYQVCCLGQKYGARNSEHLNKLMCATNISVTFLSSLTMFTIINSLPFLHLHKASSIPLYPQLLGLYQGIQFLLNLMIYPGHQINNDSAD